VSVIPEVILIKHGILSGRPLSKYLLAVFAGVAVASFGSTGIQGQQHAETPKDFLKKVPCQETAQLCLASAMNAVGGQNRLEAVKSFGFEAIQHAYLAEQSYRQDPFITAYARMKGKVDLAGGKIFLNTHSTWPESDPGAAETEMTLVVGFDGGVYRPSSGPDTPCSPADIDWARTTLELGPLRLLLTALHSQDLHFEKPEIVRSTLHPVLAFTWRDIPVRILINPFNFLPDAVETTEQFRDHWYQWGDVHRRIYFENWQAFHGVIYPTNQVEERNGILWQSTQVLSLDLNVPTTDADFKMDDGAVKKSAQSKGWDRSFKPSQSKELARGVTFYPGAWNTTVVVQDDGVVILEAPLSATYIDGAMTEAKRLNPNLPIKAVISTSDSWPHVGGVRQAVAVGVPVYILDLNRPLLDRIVDAPHSLRPDLLERSHQKPLWQVVSGKESVGTGENRMELYPLRGGATERQYMVYFPEYRLLYASDTLALNDDGSLYDPELMREVMEAAKREGLAIETVFAMHQGPMPWTSVVSMVEKSLR